jgi:hypothetical protein
MKVLLHYGPHIDEYTIKEEIPPPEVNVGLSAPLRGFGFPLKLRFCFGGQADGMPLYRLVTK